MLRAITLVVHERFRSIIFLLPRVARYKQGTAHIDLGPATVNFYFMKSGMKDVIIVPTEVSRGVKNLAKGTE